MQTDDVKQAYFYESMINCINGDDNELQVCEVSIVETRLHRKRGHKIKSARLSNTIVAAELGHKLLPNYLDREYVYVVALTNKFDPIGVQLVSIGCMNSAHLDPNRILTFLLLSSASYFMLFHNHISGDTTPSREDLAATKKLKDAGNLVGIQLVDHLIIGDSFCSMKEAGLIN